MLALLAFLLYLASHVYGTEFLDLYGVREGFQGFGLGNLAMIPYEYVVLIGLFAWMAYRTLTTLRTRTFVIGNAILVVVTMSTPLLALVFGCSPRFGDFTIVSVIALLIGSSGAHFFLTPRLNSVNATIASLQRSLEADQKELDEIEAVENADDAVLEERAEVARMRQDVESLRDINSERKEISDLRPRILKHRSRLVESGAIVSEVLDAQRRLQTRYKIGLGVGAALLTIGSALPAVAKLQAFAAGTASGFVAGSGSSAPHTPVYWVGDRVVYLTFESSKCFVHAQIANAEQAKRECPRFIAEATR